MKMRFGILIVVLTCFLNVLMTEVCAAGSDGSGVYFGIGGGATRTTIDNLESGINSNLLQAGFTSANTETNNKGGMYKAFIGYSFNPYFGIEGTYFNLGTFTFDTSVTPTGTLHGETRTQGSPEAFPGGPCDGRCRSSHRCRKSSWPGAGTGPRACAGRRTGGPRQGGQRCQ